jgi:hypothetical protein
MAADTNISKAAAKGALDNIIDRLDTGTGANARLRIYDGTQPADPDTAITTQTLLAEIDLGTLAVFGAATTGTGASSGSATATASAILPKSDSSADSSGTASWFRAVNKGATAIIDGSAGESADTPDLTLDNKVINTGQTVILNSWKVKLPFK